MAKTSESVIKEKIMLALEEIESRYPEDLFPANGTSLDCAGARFARNLIAQMRAALREILIPKAHFTPKELADRYNLTPSGMYKRLHHVNCPRTQRHEGESGRLLTVELTEDLDRFLSQPTSHQLLR